MSSTLTAEKLREALSRATPGEWRVHENPRFWVRLPTESEGDPNRDANAELIVLLVNAAPQIAEALELMRNAAEGGRVWLKQNTDWVLFQNGRHCGLVYPVGHGWQGIYNNYPTPVYDRVDEAKAAVEAAVRGKT